MGAEQVKNINGEVINHYCTTEAHLRPFSTDIYPWYDLCIYSLIPFIIMIVANTSIIYQLKKASKMRSKTTTGSDSGDLTSITAMLLGISFGFVICTLPYNIAMLIRRTSGLANPWNYLFWALSAVLVNFNHCINFYIYCLTGTKFRKEVMAMLRCSGKANDQSLSHTRSVSKTTVSTVS